jgi:DNA invertase Pin-like site-specific DNA recombinase
LLYGYARVSTRQQDTASQIDALTTAGVTKIVQEKRSGALERPALDALLARLRRGDVVVVYSMDRLSRTLLDLLRVLTAIKDAGAALRSLTEYVDTSTPFGEAMMQMLGVLAQLNRRMILQRCEAGRIAAVERGVRFGRPPTITREVALRLWGEGLSRLEIAAAVGCGPKAVYRALSGKRRCDGGAGTSRRGGT